MLNVFTVFTLADYSTTYNGHRVTRAKIINIEINKNIDFATLSQNKNRCNLRHRNNTKHQKRLHWRRGAL